MHAECLALSKDSANTNFTTTIIFIFIPLTPGARRMPERAPSSWMPAAWLIFKQGTFLGTSCLEIHPQKSFPIVRPKQLRGGEITFVVMTDVGRGSGGGTREGEDAPGHEEAGALSLHQCFSPLGGGCWGTEGGDQGEFLTVPRCEKQPLGELWTQGQRLGPTPSVYCWANC